MQIARFDQTCDRQKRAFQSGNAQEKTDAVAFAADHDFAPCGRSFHARRPIASLDRIMVSRDLKILDSGAHKTAISRRASDHLPIWADLAPRVRTL